MPRILVVEDNLTIADGIAGQLQIEGHDARVATCAVDAAALLGAFAPHLVILDVMLPDADGTQFLAKMRKRGIDVPVLILSALGGEAQKLAGFRAGADDYVTKPFGLLELLARVEALLRRSPQRAPDALPAGVLRIGDAVVNLAERTVQRGGSPVEMRPREWELLLALVRHANAVVSRSALLRDVWGYDATVQSRTVDTHIVELRRKLGDEGQSAGSIATVRKLGYRLALDPAATESR